MFASGPPKAVKVVTIVEPSKSVENPKKRKTNSNGKEAQTKRPKKETTAKPPRKKRLSITSPVRREDEDEEFRDEEDEEDNIFDQEDATPSVSESTRMRVLVSNFTDEQSERYEYYRRSSFPQPSIKKLMNTVIDGQSVNTKMSIVMGGITKVFVGELIEEARTAMEDWGETGPLRPRHLREGYRRLKANNKLPYHTRPPLFKR